MTHTGLEPAAFGLEAQRTTYCANEPCPFWDLSTTTGSSICVANEQQHTLLIKKRVPLSTSLSDRTLLFLSGIESEPRLQICAKFSFVALDLSTNPTIVRSNKKKVVVFIKLLSHTGLEPATFGVSWNSQRGTNCANETLLFCCNLSEWVSEWVSEWLLLNKYFNLFIYLFFFSFLLSLKSLASIDVFRGLSRF